MTVFLFLDMFNEPIQYYLQNVCELISLVTAIVYYRYLKRSFMKWFLPFLMFIFLGELYTKYQFHYSESNVNTYSFIGIIESIFYSYIFYNLQSNKILGKVIIILGFVSGLAYCSGIVLNSNNSTY